VSHVVWSSLTTTAHFSPVLPKGAENSVLRAVSIRFAIAARKCRQ
jgi:hypothetical protein